jgi:hypothetical protein
MAALLCHRAPCTQVRLIKGVLQNYMLPWGEAYHEWEDRRGPCLGGGGRRRGGLGGGGRGEGGGGARLGGGGLQNEPHRQQIVLCDCFDLRLGPTSSLTSCSSQHVCHMHNFTLYQVSLPAEHPLRTYAHLVQPLECCFRYSVGLTTHCIKNSNNVCNVYDRGPQTPPQYIESSGRCAAPLKNLLQGIQSETKDLLFDACKSCVYRGELGGGCRRLGGGGRDNGDGGGSRKGGGR